MTNKTELLERFSRQGFSPAEHAVLTQTAFTPRLLADVARHSIDPFYCYGIPILLAECEAALATCLEKGWLFVATEQWLEQIRSTLDAGRIFGPIQGLPSVGDVDVTESGIEILCQFRAEDRGKRSFDSATLAYLERHPFIITNILDSNERYRKERGFTVDKPNIEQVLLGYREMGEHVLRASDPTPIGPWCITWRDQLPAGYMMDVEIGDL